MGDVRNRPSLFSEDEVMEILQGLRKEFPSSSTSASASVPIQSKVDRGWVELISRSAFKNKRAAMAFQEQRVPKKYGDQLDLHLPPLRMLWPW